MAVPLMLVTTLLPTVGQLAVLAWGRESRSSTGLTFSQAFGDSLGDLAYARPVHAAQPRDPRRPRDLALSELEIPYRLPGARLRVRRDRLLLDGLGDKSTNQVILWPELTVVRVERVTEPTVWEIGSSTMIEVPSGHALRLAGVAADWLLPVPERLGEDLAAAISLRATTRRGEER